MGCHVCIDVGKTDIKPLLGTELAGHGFYLNMRTRGIRFHLYQRAILLRKKEWEEIINDDGRE